ncbi:MAG: hypothetical protein E5W98_14755 [Mesorhizobium sp.]|nr:MAG: hypothetical protein E5W98_14755 [Mesorhizobium sp.]
MMLTQSVAIALAVFLAVMVLGEERRSGPFSRWRRGVADTRGHIHTVVRTPNGNDYGKDLLRQHHEAHAHDPGPRPPNPSEQELLDIVREGSTKHELPTQNA